MTNKLLNCDCRLRIELLFNYHGDQYKIGETESHENATENEYASDTKTDIRLDPYFLLSRHYFKIYFRFSTV